VARWTKRAAARACIPSGLLTTTALLVMRRYKRQFFNLNID
jgi:hypothetical protein